MVLNLATGHVSPQLHVVFDDEFSTVPIIREVIIPPNWTDLVKCRSKSYVPYSFDLEDTWFAPYLEEYPSKNPTCVPRVAPENNRNMITSLQTRQQVDEILVSEGASVSEVIKRSVY